MLLGLLPPFGFAEDRAAPSRLRSPPSEREGPGPLGPLRVHICMQMLTDAVPPAMRGWLLKLPDLAMIATALFMLIYGTQLRATWARRLLTK